MVVVGSADVVGSSVGSAVVVAGSSVVVVGGAVWHKVINVLLGFSGMVGLFSPFVCVALFFLVRLFIPGLLWAVLTVVVVTVHDGV